MRICHRALVFAPPAQPQPPSQPAEPVKAAEADSAASEAAANAAAPTAATTPPPLADDIITDVDLLAHGIGALNLEEEAPLAAQDAGTAALVRAAASNGSDSDGHMASTTADEVAAAAATADDGVTGEAALDPAPAVELQEAEAGQQVAGQQEAAEHSEAQLWAWLTPLLLRLGLPVRQESDARYAAALCCGIWCCVLLCCLGQHVAPYL